MMLLAGCTEIKEPITADSEGFWNSYIVYPLSALSSGFLKHLARTMVWESSVLQLIIRLALLPLMIKQVKSSKAMQAIQPEMKNFKQNTAQKMLPHNKNYSKKQWLYFSKYNVNPLADKLHDIGANANFDRILPAQSAVRKKLLYIVFWLI